MAEKEKDENSREDGESTGEHVLRKTEHPATPESLSRGYESDRVNLKWTVLAAGSVVALIAFALVAIGGMVSLMGGWDTRAESVTPFSLRIRPDIPWTRSIPEPSPKLQTNPTAYRRAFMEFEEKELSSYGWEDTATGRLRIPVERAMEIIAERGIPSHLGSGRTAPNTDSGNHSHVHGETGLSAPPAKGTGGTQ